jgi:hypothetical protein
MNTFAAAIVAIVAVTTGVEAFAPTATNGNNAYRVPTSTSSTTTTTSLNSHFSSIETKLFNKQTLLKALKDMGIKSQTLKTDGEQIEARGYKGETIMADIVIQQQNNYDVAFRSNGETYELVTDLQFWQQSMPVDAFMEKVNQRYAINNLIDTSNDDGFNVDNVLTASDGTVTLEMSRYSFN